ncbi:uncharacterized protein LOC134700624 [Mytilus trossulus]|uniref:uncharacterized protein LOC134700624 n=1 Tax=Mytilus trossulus TaxID=6551 RepID=UPI003004ED2A
MSELQTITVDRDIYTHVCEPVRVGDLSVNCLLYADDIVLLSESKTGLQASLNTLSTYCSNWKLQVNVQKSKVLVFNSNGKTYLNEFFYNDNVIQTVSKYCYLGIMLKCNGNFNLAVSLLMEKARKACFKIKKTIGLDNPCKLLEKLFDSLVSPILLYCSEIWGVFDNSGDNSILEKFHMKFIKEILGVHCKAINAACRAELCRLPLCSKISFSCIKFYDHILRSENALISKVFLATEKNNPWTKKLYSIFNNLGFSNLAGGNFSIKQYLPSIKQRVIDQCTQDQSSKIHDSSKLKFYQQFHNSKQRSSYVDVLSNRLERSSLCKIRLSAHNLAIEKGRYLGLATDERVCNVCKSGEVEDENHFLLKCEFFSNYRFNFKNKILNILPTCCSENQLNINSCINSNSLKVLKVTSSYIHKCLMYRNEILASYL